MKHRRQKIKRTAVSPPPAAAMAPAYVPTYETTTSYEMRADFNSGTIQHLGSHTLRYDGQKNLGELGPAINYIPDYYGLSIRSWQAYVENDLATIVVNKHTKWVVDTGLKLKANPAALVLESENIPMDKKQREKFNDVTEARWNNWASSKESSYSGEETFHETTERAYKHARVGGDILTVLRYVDNMPKVQLIDGSRVQTPFASPVNPDSKNIISNGVEISPTGRHIGYWIRKKDSIESEMIPAYSEATGLRTAFLFHGSKWRLDYHRGLPIIANVLETLKKLDRYKEAVVASAEEVAKIVYQVVHQNFSSGESPLAGQLARAIDASAGLADLPVDSAGNAFADTVAVSTDKQVFNNPKGSELKPVNHGNGLSGFKEFYSTNADIICAAVDIPPNVAFSLYTDSFSASRAATKDWDHSIDVARDHLYTGFLKYVYELWFYTEVMKNKISAPGYIEARLNKNSMVYNAYQNARFTGPHFPHIDPLKEVKAEREKLGPMGANIPLTTIEQATEALGTGDSDSNMEQFADEMVIAVELGIEEKEEETPVT